MMKWQWIGSVCLGLAIGATSAVPEADAATSRYTAKKLVINNVRYRRTSADRAELGSMGVLRGTQYEPSFFSAATGFASVQATGLPLKFDITSASKAEVGAEALVSALEVTGKGRLQQTKEGKFSIYKVEIEKGSYAEQLNTAAGKAWLDRFNALNSKGTARIVTAVWVVIEASQAASIGGAFAVGVTPGGATSIPVGATAGGAFTKKVDIAFTPGTILAFAASKVIFNKEKTAVTTLQEDRPGWLY